MKRITFDRIGRNHQVADLMTRAETDELLEQAIFKHARPHLRSSDVEVVFDDDMTGGVILVGGFRPGGEFKIEEVAP